MFRVSHLHACFVLFVRRLSVVLGDAQSERFGRRSSVIRGDVPDERPTTEIKAELGATNNKIEVCAREIEYIKAKLQELQENFERIQGLGIWARAPLVWRMIEKATATDGNDTSERITSEDRSQFSYKGFFSWLFCN